MKQTTPEWHLFQTFLAVTREGSLSGAARALDATQPTVGRQIAMLEKSLGVTLFTRSRDGLSPTPAGLQLIGPAEAMDAAAAVALRTSSAEAAEERGTVRVTASEIIGTEVLPVMLAQLQREHPRISVELSLTNRNENLLRGDADIAVRMARPAQVDLVTRRIGTIGIGLYAHRRYLAGRCAPERIEDLRKHTLIGFDRDTAYLHPFASRGFTREAFALRTDSQLAQLAAVRAGCGIGACQQPIAYRDRTLVPILAGSIGFPMEMWLVMHRDARTSRRIRLAFDHLAAGLVAYSRPADA